MSILKSWAGIIEFCNPRNISGLKAIINILYLNQTDVRKAILDLLYEVIGVQPPMWTADYATALSVLDPADFQDSWRLTDGFVAFEGRSVLPSLVKNIPNVTEIHRALLLYCFIENDLLDALAEVIVSSDLNLSIRTTILLGKLIQLMCYFLPMEIYRSGQCLPILILKASEGNYQARAAISALQDFHQVLKNRPAACSMYLDAIIQSGNIMSAKVFNRDIGIKEGIIHFKHKRDTLDRRVNLTSSGSSVLNDYDFINIDTNFKTNTKKNKIFNFFEQLKEYEKLFRDSKVISHPDTHWDWDLIITLLRLDSICKIDELTIKFIKNLVFYFKPSNNRFSHEELYFSRQQSSSINAGLELIDWLLKNSELDSIRLLTDLFTDISGQLLSISTSRSAHDCLFSPQHMTSTMCQQYFLFIGRMCKNEHGLNILTNTDVFKQ